MFQREPVKARSGMALSAGLPCHISTNRVTNIASRIRVKPEATTLRIGTSRVLCVKSGRNLACSLFNQELAYRSCRWISRPSARTIETFFLLIDWQSANTMTAWSLDGRGGYAPDPYGICTVKKRDASVFKRTCLVMEVGE